MTRILLALLLVATAATAADTKLWYDKPAADNWMTEALPIGNGDLGLPAGIAEMLIQSHKGNDECGMMNDELKRGKEQMDSSFITHPSSFIISLLPALPKAWSDGKVTGLRARGNFTVDMEWREGKVTTYRITSPEPKKVRVQVGPETKVVQSDVVAR